MYYNTFITMIERINNERNRELLVLKIKETNKLSFLEKAELIKLTYEKIL